MKAIAIHPNQWSSFCEAFTQLNKGTLIDLNVERLNGRKEEIARRESFHKMTFDTGDACNNMISITLGQDGARRMNHVVIEPIHLRLKQHQDGHKFLQIEAEDGITFLTFHSGKLPLMNFESEFAGFAKNNGGPKEAAIPS